MHLFASDGMHKPQRHGVQSLPRTSVEAIVYKLFVFTKVSPFQDFVTAIPLVIEEYMTDMLHVHTYLMRTPGFKNTFHQSDISQTFKHPVVGDGMFPLGRIGHNGHLHPVFRIAGDTAYDGTFILIDNAPYQCAVSTLSSFIKELDAQIGFGIRCLSDNQ